MYLQSYYDRFVNKAIYQYLIPTNLMLNAEIIAIEYRVKVSTNGNWKKFDVNIE